MAIGRMLELSTNEYETIYRILITTSVEGISEQRNLNDVLDSFESAGDGLPGGENGVPRMYTAQDGALVELTKSQVSTLKNHIGKGIGRFQAWSTRCIPAVLDRMETMKAEE